MSKTQYATLDAKIGNKIVTVTDAASRTLIGEYAILRDESINCKNEQTAAFLRTLGFEVWA